MTSCQKAFTVGINSFNIDLFVVCSEKSEQDCDFGAESDPRKITALFYGVGLAERLLVGLCIVKVLKNLHVMLFFMFCTIDCL